GDDLLGVIHRVVDVTPLPEQALTKMAATRYEVAPVDDAPVWEGLAAALNEFAALARQNRQLQEALTSRATIDQAKGMLMLRCACGPEEAFALLKRASQNTNVRLAHVAAAMVHQARNGEAAVIDMIHASMDALPDTAT
ncbi:MAG TPA: ANTAR domain-containing protein, partial [Segeticoccus sp.]|uniref:ANTAR domain-containing protein n=1 Tax=Segeticoccus sp. TaxID=2706531 RepID=UPI002D804EF3